MYISCFAQQIGAIHPEDWSVSVEAAIALAGPRVPLVFVVAPGADPAETVLSLAKRKKIPVMFLFFGGFCSLIAPVSSLLKPGMLPLLFPPLDQKRQYGPGSRYHRSRILAKGRKDWILASYSGIIFFNFFILFLTIVKK